MLRQRLQMNNDEIAVLIGSKAIQKLHDTAKAKNAEQDKSSKAMGSESADPLYDDSYYVSYEGQLSDGILSHWLKHRSKENKLLSAPILVSTIDHLMPATEAERGGRQIAPMLRLLTSDLVLDEPDDLNLNDLPALTRLVNWAGMLGSNVLLSSATLPPDLVNALFEAYQAGREYYRQSCLPPDTPSSIVCAWFDEKSKPQIQECALAANFVSLHQKFVTQRVKKITTNPALRLAKLIDITPGSNETKDIISTMAAMVAKSITTLHNAHHVKHSETKTKLSIGLIRMANINPMVALSIQLLQVSPDENTQIHFCIYHSQHPLIIRSKIEQQLDDVLKRDVEHPDKIWEKNAIKPLLQHKQENQIVIVLATAVAEVGRDHDYDWAIVEPSSMRSIIQLAGRIQRHRQHVPNSPNLFIFNKNYNALKNMTCAYYTPGFETKNLHLVNKDLHEALTNEQLNVIRATPRIQKRENLKPTINLVDLEQQQLHNQLFDSNHESYHASLWWQTENITSSTHMQQVTCFRSGQAQERYCLYIEDEYTNPEWNKKYKDGTQTSAYIIKKYTFTTATGIRNWLSVNYQEAIEQLAEQQGMSLNYASKVFGEVSLRKLNKSTDFWSYEPTLGLFRNLTD